jgi:hypothetical protein
MPVADEPQLLDPKETAELLKVSSDTLAIWRCTARYPLPFIRVGYAIRYDKKDVLDFLERRKVRQQKAR